MNKSLPITVALVCTVLAAAARAEAPALGQALAQQVEQLAQAAASSVSAQTPGARVAIEVGQLDPRLRLAPCEQVQPYLPPHTRLWGRARIGLRCVQGARPWNVYLPVTVRVFAPALVATTPLPAGTVLTGQHLRVAEVDLAAEPATAVRQPELALGRALQRALAAGDTLRADDLRARQWFAAGDSVRIVARGNGYAVSGEGRALSAGLEGQPVRVRTETGRIVSGLAVAERRVEVVL